ncbi:MAG: hypothetical protein IT365_29755 [Candidatus Hydrogenedentes bacterium]|nr:hypothetical protein [Candidatus Hydrogenedentota bacterium]
MTQLFSPIFLAIMVGVHLPAAWWWRRRMLRGVDGLTRESVLREQRGAWLRLQIAYWAAILGVCGWALLDFDAIVSGQRSQALSSAGLILFHLIWWPFVFPCMQRLDRALREHGVLVSPATLGPARTASLKPRCVRDYLPAWSTAAEIAFLAVAVTVLATRALTLEAIEPRLAWGATVFAATALLFMAAYAFWIRMEVRQSYAWLRGTASDKEMETHRRFRVRIVFAGQLLGAAVFFGASALVIEVAHGTFSESMAGMIGGITGCAFGIAGGVAGTVAGMRAARLQRVRTSEDQTTRERNARNADE